MNGHPEDADDVRRRPVVLHAGQSEATAPRRTRRYLAWAGTGLLGVVAAGGLVAGGTAVWSAFDPGTPGRSPAPLWFPPPETITPQSEQVTPTPDDHGGDRTRTPSPTATTEPGDDKGGDRTGSGKSSTTSGSTSGKHGSGKSSDDGPNHH
ncbi:hypothetical protein EV137_0605 [Kribbella pratensis]|uniref:CAP domain-containing protein n=1 Tax=Kribbella pratensis TaxID=2512112 RepID=A0ABY2FJN1_9ACTN|nr:hypothetical protein [Kribbella pratensis]TDW93330.1 hypothetical protein EV137_0605 [Kribbella pratensis]